MRRCLLSLTSCEGFMNIKMSLFIEKLFLVGTCQIIIKV